MTRHKRMLLGPCPCQGCGQLVYWADLPYGPTPGRAWRDPDGKMHRCRYVPSYVEYRTSACWAGSDGDCFWSLCPQTRDGEPMKSGRDCPLLEEGRAVVSS
jgi:hypothetical protein